MNTGRLLVMIATVSVGSFGIRCAAQSTALPEAPSALLGKPISTAPDSQPSRLLLQLPPYHIQRYQETWAERFAIHVPERMFRDSALAFFTHGLEKSIGHIGIGIEQRGRKPRLNFDPTAISLHRQAHRSHKHGFH